MVPEIPVSEKSSKAGEFVKVGIEPVKRFLLMRLQKE